MNSTELATAVVAINHFRISIPLESSVTAGPKIENPELNRPRRRKHKKHIIPVQSIVSTRVIVYRGSRAEGERDMEERDMEEREEEALSLLSIMLDTT